MIGVVLELNKIFTRVPGYNPIGLIHKIVFLIFYSTFEDFTVNYFKVLTRFFINIEPPLSLSTYGRIVPFLEDLFKFLIEPSLY